jgi:glyoxylase-like metal-dependent hydrolase (beta-lactamase superfamily II)
VIGAEIWAQRKAKIYIDSPLAADRLAQRRTELAPWVDEHTRVVPPDVWIDGDTDFRLGGVTFRLIYSGGAHSPEDTMMYVVDDRVLYAGDLVFAGRIPFVVGADSRGWLEAMRSLVALQPPPAIVVPGHGPVSRDVAGDLTLTRDYLLYLRDTIGRAVADLQPFDEAYKATDWSPFAALPAFAQANRGNAYAVYLQMEQESLDSAARR